MFQDHQQNNLIIALTRTDLVLVKQKLCYVNICYPRPEAVQFIFPWDMVFEQYTRQILQTSKAKAQPVTNVELLTENGTVFKTV